MCEEISNLSRDILIKCIFAHTNENVFLKNYFG